MIRSMRTVNIRDAQRHFWKHIAAVEKGDEVVITRAGRPAARLIPFVAEERPIGIDDGRLEIADDFDSWLPREFEPYV
ncbi:MAG: prevent-host-death family protein [Candidatus Eremiobacteraeota bacterium]|nr:prevent-host-death family protein [Candidatus Eremiobacteraeota bacterium]